MRKALMGLIMAATVMTPLAAQAQERGSRANYQRLEQRNQQRYEQRQAREQARGEQRQVRQERQEPRQAQRQPQVQQQQAPVAVAQRGERRGGGDGNRGGYRGGDRNRGDRGAQGATSSGYQRGWQGSNDPRQRQDADRYNRRAQENAIRYGTRDQARDAARDARRDGNDPRQWQRDRRDDRRDWRNDRRDDRRADRRDWDRDWNRGWRNDRRYNWQDWRYRNRNLYRLSPYYSPYRNWGYQRFSIGIFLEPLFYGRNYWIGDPWQYRLPPAPPGTQWIRYYDDVLLVDTYSGRVVDVIYDFFWR